MAESKRPRRPGGSASARRAPSRSIQISVIAPIYNEIDNLPELHRRVTAVMRPLRLEWELLLVDDGSTDGSTEAIRSLARADAHIRPILFARNFGHQIAVTAGLDLCRGQAAVIIDADLQDPPELIPELVAKWREGYEVVYAVRAEREGETWFKRLTASVFYRLIYRITDVKIPLDVGDFRLLDRQVVDTLKRMRERHRFLRGMSAWVGFRQTGVDLQARRPHGRRHQVPVSARCCGWRSMPSPGSRTSPCSWRPTSDLSVPG